jgi:DNA (cytosine-5)-methyltransferase 1
MTAYYNEIDRFCCDWLSNLMDANLITPGKIDDRSIVDVRPDDLAGFERVHFFAGIGGWDYSLNAAGWSGHAWTGSCPCQPFSLAGAQKGFNDDRHLWPEFRRLIAECSPPVVFGEQVASASEWLGLVRGDLEALGYAVGAVPIQAASAGADHLRDRYWFVADANDAGSQGRRVLSERVGQRTAWQDGLANAARHDEQRGRQSSESRGPQVEAGGLRTAGDVGHTISARAGRFSGGCRCAEAESSRQGHPNGGGGDASQSSDSALDWVIGADGKARRVKSGVRLLAHGIPNRVGLLRGFGNAIDPRPAAAFIEAFMTHTLSSQERKSPWELSSKKAKLASGMQPPRIVKGFIAASS